MRVSRAGFVESLQSTRFERFPNMRAPMGRINWVRVCLGGLLAGLIINLGDFASHWLGRGGDWWFFIALAHPLERATDIGPYVGLHFLHGLAAIWLYAATRPRFGAGPRTAVLVGFASCLIMNWLPLLSFWGLLATHPWLQSISARSWVMNSFWELPEIILATLAGAWVYKE